MIKSLFVLEILCASISMCSCNSPVRTKQLAIADLYTAKRDADSFVVKFRHKGDTVFLYYYFAFKDGNYLNYPTDSNDYAGFFAYSNLKERNVILPIKDYRQFWNDSTKVYNLALDFQSDTTCHWFIDSTKYGILDFLPHNIVLTKNRLANHSRTRNIEP